MVPFLMVVGGAALLATSGVQPLTPFVFGLYVALTGCEAIRVGRGVGWAKVPIVWAIFPLLHVSHGLGFGTGLLRFAIHPDTGGFEPLLPLQTETCVARREQSTADVRSALEHRATTSAPSSSTHA